MVEEGLSIAGRRKLFVLLSAIVTCALIALYAGIVAHITIVYTHFFYIPILLAGIWYQRKAVYVALFFGVVHILITYSHLSISINEFARAAIFLVVAYAVGYVSEREVEKGRALQESQKNLARIIDGANIPAFAINKEHKITHWNTALEVLTGIKKEEIVGTDKQWIAFYPEKRPVMADFIVDKKSEREIKELYGDKCKKSALIEGAYESLDFFSSLGEEGKWLLFTAAPIRDSEGVIYGAIETLLDVTEHKQAEEALKGSAQKLSGIIGSVSDLMCMIDRDYNIVWSNDIAKHLFGPDLEGKKCYEAYRQRNKPCEPCLVRNVFEDGQIHEQETEVIGVDGRATHLWCTANVAAHYPDGKPKWVVEISRDITDRKQAEKRQLELINELEAANEDLRNFVHIASHDLKSPLRAIHTLAEWMVTDYSDKLDEEGKKRLDLMMNRAKRMHGLLDGVLRYSRIGRVKEEKEEVNLNTLISEVIDMIDRPENIDIEVADELPTIYCDRALIGSVLQNLLSNAVRYMEKPKGRVTVGCTDEGKYWKFNVADNGPGIDEKYHDLIFQIFQTLHPRDEVESTGIGLSIVKKIVETQGGKIWVESKEGEGSTFFFTVPK